MVRSLTILNCGSKKDEDSTQQCICQYQDKALQFYTEVLGFVKKVDLPAGEHQWLTVVSLDEPDGTELLLEPNGNPAAQTFLQKAIFEQGLPTTAFAVEDVQKEYERMKEMSVVFHTESTQMERLVVAVLDGTCGNLIQLYQV